MPAGVPITFVLRNDDPIDHEWIVGDEATHTRHRLGTEPHHGERPTEQSIAALSTVRTTVTFASPGTYRYICHLPGHEAYGMVGVVTVTGAERHGHAPGWRAHSRPRAGRPGVSQRYLSRSAAPLSTACAAASRATGTRNGEQET